MRRLAHALLFTACASLFALAAVPVRAQDDAPAAGDERAKLSIGIAPFETVGAPGESVPDLASELAARVLAQGVGRTLSPATLSADGAALAEPTPERVRALAREHGLDALVVGRVTRLGDRVSIDVRLREGASGAVAGTYVAELPLADPAAPVLDRLAAQLVTGALRRVDVSLAPPDAPPAGADAGEGSEAGAPTTRRERKPTGGPAMPLDALATGDEPFSIRSEELEVSEAADGRRLTFRGGVVARRGDTVLEAARLEAFYPAGEKRPTRLDARGGVRVRQGEREARCDEADYRHSDQKIVCRGHVVMRDGDDELRAETVVFDLERQSVHVEGGTELALQPRAGEPRPDGGADLLGDLPTEGPVTIRAEGLEAVEQPDGGRIVRFEGSVLVAQEDLTLRAREIEALYPAGEAQPARLVARGDVVVVQQGREARCDEAVYLREERQLDCVGGAMLRDREDQVFGRAIRFDLAEERLVVTGETRLVLAPRASEETATP